MVKRIDDDYLLNINPHAMLKKCPRFTDRNAAAIAKKLDGKGHYFCNKAISRIGLNNEDRKEIAALKRSVDEVKAKKRNNVIYLKTVKVIR